MITDGPVDVMPGDGGGDRADNEAPDGQDEGARPDTPDVDGSVSITCTLRRVLVSTSNFASSGLSMFDPISSTAMVGPSAAQPDNVPGWAPCRGAVLHRDRGVLTLLDPLDPLGTTRVEIDLNPAGGSPPYATNPQRVLSVSNDRAYVPVLARNEVVIVDLQGDSPTVSSRIDLSSFVSAADPDGLVEAVDAILIGDRAYLALARYSFDMAFAIHFDAGSVLAVVDTTTDALFDMDPAIAGVQGIELEGNNPWRGLAFDAGNNRLLVGSTGDGFALDGGIEAIDLSTNRSIGYLLTETELGAEINGFAFFDPTLAYVLAGRDVFPWNLTANTVGTTPIAIDIDGVLLLEDRVFTWTRTGDAAGLRMFDAADGHELTRSVGPWTFGILPISALSAMP